MNSPPITKPDDLFDFMLTTTKEMASEYERIQKRTTEDPGTAGDQGEENWAEILRHWLPPAYHVVTKGRILNHEGRAGPQVDILILHPAYPEKLRDKKLYSAGGVAAAFECKVTLTAAHIDQAIRNAVEIRRLLPIRQGSPYKELFSPIAFGCLAHSHSWKGAKSTPRENIERQLRASDEAFVKHPREALDFLCVADLATWTSVKLLLDQAPNTGFMRFSGEVEGSAVICTPIGALIVFLLRALAWEDPPIRPLSDYFRLSRIAGSGTGTGRNWSPEVFSEAVRHAIPGKLSGGDQWTEWLSGMF